MKSLPLKSRLDDVGDIISQFRYSTRVDQRCSHSHGVVWVRELLTATIHELGRLFGHGKRYQGGELVSRSLILKNIWMVAERGIDGGRERYEVL